MLPARTTRAISSAAGYWPVDVKDLKAGSNRESAAECGWRSSSSESVLEKYCAYGDTSRASSSGPSWRTSPPDVKLGCGAILRGFNNPTIQRTSTLVSQP